MLFKTSSGHTKGKVSQFMKLLMPNCQQQTEHVPLKKSVRKQLEEALHDPDRAIAIKRFLDSYHSQLILDLPTVEETTPHAPILENWWESQASQTPESQKTPIMFMKAANITTEHHVDTQFQQEVQDVSEVETAHVSNSKKRTREEAELDIFADESVFEQIVTKVEPKKVRSKEDILAWLQPASKKKKT